MRLAWGFVALLLFGAVPLRGQRDSVMADSIVPTAPVRTMSQLLTARVPGLQVLSQDGTMGAGPLVLIHGYSGGAAVSGPLLFIDGIRVDDASGSGTDIAPMAFHPATGRFDDLDPSEIARIDVLSGATAASIYGPGAGNGVILVTTTRHGGAPISGQVMAEGGVSTQPVDAPQSYYSWGHAGNAMGQCPLLAQAEQVCTLDSVTHFNPLTASGTSPLIPAYSQRYRANVGGTFGAQQISISGTYADAPGTLELPSVDRAVYRSDFSQQPSASQRRPNTFDQGQVRGALVSHVGSTAELSLSGGYADLHQRDGAIDSFLSDAGLGSGARDMNDGWAGATARPAFDLADLSSDHAQHVMWSLQGQWRPAASIALHATIGTDAVTRNIGDRALGFAGSDTTTGVERQRQTQYTADFGGSWSAPIRRGLESRTSAGLQYLAANASDSTLLTTSGTSLPLDNSAYHVSDLTQSAYLDETLAIADQVSVGGTARWDHHRFQSFRVSSSAAYASARASWAVLGAAADPRIRLHGAVGETSTPLGTTEFAAMSVPLQAADFPLRPATRQRELEAGIDGSLPGDRITASVTTYARRSVHALFPVTVAGPAGEPDRIAEQGTVTDRGIEFSTTARIIDRPAVEWDATLSAFVHQNKVLQTTADEEWYDGMLRVAAGYPVFGVWALPFTYDDRNHDGVIEPDEVTVEPAEYVGPGSPTHEASLGSTVHLLRRRLHVGVLFDYRGGYVLPDQNGVYQSVVQTTRAQNIAGSSLEQQALSVVALTTPGWARGYADRVSAVRWRELSVSAALPVPRPIEVTLAVRNLALWTGYRGDPDIELGEQPLSIASIAPVLQLPQPRTWLLRVSAGF